MFRLVSVSGPNRGSKFVLLVGDNSIGRSPENSVVLNSTKVSKNHCKLKVSGQAIVLKDLGSSNGTFVNGELSRERVLKVGDRIGIGEFVLEVSEFQASLPALRTSPPESPVLSTDFEPISTGDLKSTSLSSSSQSMMLGPGKPKSLIGQILYRLESQILPIFYEMHQNQDAQNIWIGFVSLFLLGNLVLSINPLISLNEETVVKEVGRRASYMAKQISEQNAGFLAQGAETKTDIGSVDKAEGVRLAVLVDLENRIIAPGSRLNQYLASGSEANLALTAREAFRLGREQGLVRHIDEVVVGIEPVKVYSASQGKNVVVAMAVVSIETRLFTPDIGSLGLIYSQSLIFTSLLAMICFWLLYRVTLKPFEKLEEELDLALKGDASSVSIIYKHNDLKALWDLINACLERIPRNDDVGSRMGFGSNSSNVHLKADEEAGGLFRQLGAILPFGVLAIGADHKIIALNEAFEELSGIRASGSLGQDVTEVARDQSMAAFLADLLTRTPCSEQGLEETYEFSGVDRKLVSIGLGASGEAPKAILVLIPDSNSES